MKLIEQGFQSQVADSNSNMQVNVSPEALSMAQDIMNSGQI